MTDGDNYRKPKLIKMQETSDFVVPSPAVTSRTQILHLRLREHHRGAER